MMRFLKKKKIPAILKILLGVALTHCILPLQAFTAGNSDMPIHDATISISVIYGIIAALSLILAVGYCILVRKKEIWLVFMHFAVFLVNFGYFMLSVSKNLSFALAANRIAYLGAVFLPFFMLMTILDACRMKYHKPLFGCLIGISAVVYLIAASPGYLDCYYSSVAIVFVNGVAKLEKTYGPLHSLYYVYLFTYFAAMVAVICYSVIRKKINTWKHAALLAVVTLLNIIIWFVEQFIYWDFEFLSVSYLLSVLLLVFLYAMLEDYSRLQSRTVILEDKTVPCTEDLEQIGTYWPEILSLSRREKDVLKKMLEKKKRKEIAEELCITENTVKKHVTNIFSKLHVTNRDELFDRIRRLVK